MSGEAGPRAWAKRWPTALLGVGLLTLLLSERLSSLGAASAVAASFGALACVSALALRVRSLRHREGGARVIERWLSGGHLAVLATVIAFAAVAHSTPALFDPSYTEPRPASSLWAWSWPVLWTLLLPALWAAEGAYSRMGPPAAGSDPHRVRGAAARGLSFGLLLLSVASLNYVASQRDLRVDVSYFRTTLPSEGTQAAVARLDGDLKVVLFYRRDSDVLPRVRRYFEALSENGRVPIEVVDYDFEPELARRHQVRGNGHALLLWSAATGTPAPPTAAETTPEGTALAVSPPRAREPAGLAFSIGEGLASARSNLRELDGHFMRALRQLTQPELRLALTVGHGERTERRATGARASKTVTMRKVLSRLHMATANLDPAAALGPGVPEDTAAVIVFGPSEPFLPEEVAALVRFVEGGGRMLVMLDPDVDVGLQRLLERVGVLRLPGKVASERSHMRRSNTRMDRALVFSNRYGTHPAVATARRNADDVTTVFFGAGGLAEAAGPSPPRSAGGAGDLKVSFPLHGGEDFFRDRDGDYERDEDEPAEAVGLIAAAEVAPAGGTRPGRVVVIGDGDFMTDPLARNRGNLMVFVDALSWLLEGAGSASLVADVASEADVLIEHSQGQQRLWFYVTTVLLPLPIALLGLLRFRRRRSGAGA